MVEDSKERLMVILVSDGNDENLFWGLINILKQNSFKNKFLNLLVFVKNLKEKEQVEKISQFFEKDRILVFDFKSIIDILLATISTQNVKFFSIIFDFISLRPDTFDLLISYLNSNDHLDGVFSDFILSLDKVEYEITDSHYVSNFPAEFGLIPNSSKLLPSLLVVKPKVLLEFLQEHKTHFTFNLLNFFNFLCSKGFLIEKADVILGAKYIEIDLPNNEYGEPIKEKWAFEQIQKKFGKNLVRLLSFNELNSLPYHFSNPYNDLVSIVIFWNSNDKEIDHKKTIDFLSFQNHKNIEILRCNCNIGNSIFAFNLYSLIAIGKFLFFLNSGGEIFPNALETLLDVVKKNNIGYVYFDYVFQEEQRVVRNLDFSYEKLKRFNYIPNYVFLSRSIFLKNNFLDEDLPWDYAFWDFWIGLGKNGIFGIRYPEPLIKVKKVYGVKETINCFADAQIKAKIVLKHKELFSAMQVEWANSVILDNSLFDNSKVPIGIIPNNVLLTKILTDKSEVAIMNKKRKLLFVMYGWNDSGGGTIFPKTVAGELSLRNWEVSVFYASTKFDPTKPLYSLETEKKDNIQFYGLYNRPAPFNDPENPERETSDPEVERIFRQVLESYQPELIHIHNLHGLCLSLPKIAKETLDVPIVFTPHNYFLIDPNLYMINSDLTNWTDTDFFKNSELAKKYPEKKHSYQERQEFSKRIVNEYLDLVMSVSRKQKEFLSEFAGNDKNIIVVHQANKVVDELWKSEVLNNESRRKVPKKVRFGYIGGGFALKGIHNLVRAAQHFLQNDVEFHVFGFVLPKYMELLNSLDNKRMVTYHGEYNIEDLEKIAGKLDVGIVPLISEESAPLVVMEMNALRLPVLGSNIGGMPDFIVDGVNGFLFEPTDIDSLVSAIRFCSLNPEIIEEIRGKLESVHSFENYISHLENIYNALINRKLKDPKEYELIVTNRLLSKPKVVEIKFTKTVSFPDEIQRSFLHLGYELVKLNIKQEDVNFVLYEAEFKVPKEVTITQFFEETKTKHEVSSSREIERSAPQEPLLFEDVEQKELEEKKVFDLNELEGLVFGSSFEHKVESDKYKYTETHLDRHLVADQYKPELNVVWEGSQFVYHSLALINREHCSNLIDTNLVEVTIIPYETEQFQPIGNLKYEKLAKKDIRIKDEPPDWIKKLPYVWIRHQWPPKEEPPKGAKWVIMQPWEFTILPKRFVEIFLQADEIWVPSNYTRQAFINSGIPFNKVQVIPNGIDPWLFQPNGRKYPLNTEKKLKFLYVGGTTYRKGFDVLLQSYVKSFTSNDDVVLVVKDMGTESFYRGQTAEDLIKQVRNTPNSPEIIYIKDYLTEEEITSLYRACDVFVSPYRGEGFSLPTLEAMACGLPVIVTDGGATEDFVLDSFAWKIPSYKISIGSTINNDPLVGEAFLFEPDGDHLADLLKSIYQNPADITVRGILASSFARTYWTWNRSTLKILSRLDGLFGKGLSIKAKDVLIDKKDAQILLGVAEEYFAEGNTAEAFRIYKEIEGRLAELSFKYKLFYFLRMAIIYILNNQFESAMHYLEKVVDLNYGNIDSLYLKAKMLYLQSNLVESLEMYTELVSKWNNERFFSMIGNSLDQILVDMANIMLEMNDIDGALQLFTNSLKLNEQKVDAYIGAAKCFIQIKDFEEAKRMLDWGLKIDSDNLEAKNLLDEIMVRT